VFILCWGGGGGGRRLRGFLKFNKKKWKEFQKGESFESFWQIEKKKRFHSSNQ
jgi:hypothetical protein